MANLTVFLGARPCLLTDQEARRLAQLLRASFTDEHTAEAAAALRLASRLELAVDEDLNEPVEIASSQAAAVARAVPDVTAHAYDGLELLLHAAKRLADKPAE